MTNKKLTKLTPEQKAILPQQAKKWLDIGLNTEPINFEKAKGAVIDAYKIAGLQSPKYFYRFQSPLSAAVGATILKTGAQVRDQVWAQVRAQVGDQVGARVWARVWARVGDQVGARVRDQVGARVRDQVRDQVGAQVGAQVRDQVGDQVRDQVGDQVYGSHDAHWLGFYETFAMFGIEDARRLRPLMELAKHCGWWAPYEHCAILQDRPELILFDDQKRLHCENGPSVKFRDGFSVYSWHGTRVPRDWITDKTLDAKTAIQWGNMEQRRAACEIVGWATVLKELNAKTIDKNVNPFVGELLEVEIPDIGNEKFLKVMCGTEREFALPVPPDMQRASQAQAWLNFTTEDMYLPQVRT